MKLDLNYLNEVAPFPNGILRVSLKFDLIRTDRRKRLYLFEDIDHVKVIPFYEHNFLAYEIFFFFPLSTLLF